MNAISATGRVGLVAHEPRVGHHGPVGPVGHHPDEVVDVVDLEQVAHQRLRRRPGGLEAAVQRLAGELDGAVGGALAVAGQHRAAGSRSVPSRSRTGIGRDERGEPLPRRCAPACPACPAARAWWRTLRGHRPSPSALRSRPRSRSAAHRAAGRSRRRSRPGFNSATVSWPSTPVCVTSARPDADEQEGNCQLALLHEHLAGRRRQRAQLRGERRPGPRSGSRRRLPSRRVRRLGQQSGRTRHEATMSPSQPARSPEPASRGTTWPISGQSAACLLKLLSNYRCGQLSRSSPL